MLSLVLLLHVSSALKLVEYKFYKNYGQIFYDFSGNSRHAISGTTINVDTSDVLGTDRGAFLDGLTDKITLPANEKDTRTFDLPSVFTILFWRKWLPELGDVKRSIFERSFTSFMIYLERLSKSSYMSLKVITKYDNFTFSSLVDVIPSNY